MSPAGDLSVAAVRNAKLATMRWYPVGNYWFDLDRALYAAGESLRGNLLVDFGWTDRESRITNDPTGTLISISSNPLTVCLGY